MNAITPLRHYAADAHARIGQVYEPGVPYWVHLFICELIAVAFNLGPRVRRVVWAHDLPEDVKTKHAELRAAGWTSEECGDIYRCTDEEGATREERKVKTLPKIALGGHFAVAPKVSDRTGNRLYGLLSGSVGMDKKYRHEHPSFRGHLFDVSDAEMLALWYFLDQLMSLRTKKMTKSQFKNRPLRKLVDSWIARRDELFAADKVDLLPEWHKLKALLDEQYGLHGWNDEEARPAAA